MQEDQDCLMDGSHKVSKAKYKLILIGGIREYHPYTNPVYFASSQEVFCSEEVGPPSTLRAMYPCLRVQGGSWEVDCK